MRITPLLAILMTTAFAQQAAAELPLVLAQATSTEESNPLAPFLKRNTPAPETPAQTETPATPGADTTIKDVPRKSLPRTEPTTPRADTPAEPARPAEPTVVREPTSLASISPNRLYEIIRDKVDRVEVDPSGGDTTLEGELDGTAFQIYFYECDGGDMTSVANPDSECLGFEWRSYFFDYRARPDDVNEWNSNYHYGKLYIDGDGDLAVQLNVIVEGGIEERNILTTLAWFRAVLDGVHGYYKR